MVADPLRLSVVMLASLLGGHAWGPVYLFVRVPLQAFILLWVYWFAIRPRDASSYAKSLHVAQQWPANSRCAQTKS